MAAPDPFDSFLRNPSRETYAAVRRAVIKDKSYNPYSNSLESAASLLEQNRFQEFIDHVPSLMPDHLLSPRLHMMVSFAWRELGDEEGAKFEMSLAHLCIEGILKSGDGSRANPYPVLRVSDEYDVLGALGKKLTKQSLLKCDGKSFDAIDCEDGSVIHFDITDMFAALNRQFTK
ncbi:MAG: DUF4919 domain-containing protein [Planctomycetes bacterium]|nr:DUF4919 domain-containing protein [Planctomycetota bacterium]